MGRKYVSLNSCPLKFEIMSSSMFFTPLIIFLMPFLLILFFMQKKKQEQEPKKKLPPGPKKLPFIGNLHQLGELPHRSLHRLSLEYGSLMFLQLGSVPTLVISSCDMAREVFKKHDIIFSSRPVLCAGKKLSYNCSDVTFAPYGKHWREVRKHVLLVLLSAKRVQSFESIREDEVKLMIDFLISASPSVSGINLSELTLSLANNVICRVAFGKKYGDYEGKKRNEFNEIVHETVELLGVVNIADYFPLLGWFNKFNGFEARLEKNFKELDKFYDQVIKEHLDPSRPKSDHQDIVDVLLRVQNDPTTATELGNEQIKGVIMDMFFAGTDTSAATLVWIMAELMKNPSVMKKAQDEVRQNFKGKWELKENNLSKLGYLKMVVMEALRLHPPVPLLIPRETRESCIIGGYEIPAKTRVFINTTAISKDPKYWENPMEFRPERFLNSSVDFRGHDFELLPFGAGRRICPGIDFAVQLIELALANLLYHFDWKLPEGMGAEDVDMKEALGIVMHKKTPLYLVVSAQHEMF